MRPLPDRLPLLALAVLVTACAPGMGDPRPYDLPVAALRADGQVTPEAVGAVLRDSRVRLALVTGPADQAWFHAVRAASGLESITRPGMLESDLGVAFLGLEPVGDTTVELRHGDTTFRVHDALYDLGRERFVDLLAFRVGTGAEARPLLTSLSAYIATDVLPGAAVVLAVAVPSAAVGDSVARLLSPMYRGVAHCGASPAAIGDSGVRLFYGPEARMFCTSAEAVVSEAADQVRADLVVGRQR